jgi:DNA-binding transcriptional LysR family regulator
MAIWYAPRMLDVKRLRVLKEVAAQGSFSAAADSLAYTQSAVSQQIAALEREAATVLVERGARGIRLTEAGEALVRHADAVFARLSEAEAELDAIAGLRGGRLRLASFETAGATLVPLAIAAFRGKHPAVDLSLLDQDPEESLPRLIAGELELALGHDTEDIAENVVEHVEIHHLLDDPMYLVLPREHKLASKRRVTLKDAAGEPWINSRAGCPCSMLVTRACDRVGFSPHVAFETDDYLAMQGYVAAGVGVALIPDLGLTTLRDDVVVRSLGMHAPVRRIYAATPIGGYRSPATSAMLEILHEVAAGYKAERAGLAAVS